MKNNNKYNQNNDADFDKNSQKQTQNSDKNSIQNGSTDISKETRSGSYSTPVENQFTSKTAHLNKHENNKKDNNKTEDSYCKNCKHGGGCNC